MKLAWAAIAHPDHPYGYGVINGRLSRALHQAGATILPPRAFGWDAIVGVALPLAWLTGPAVVMHTMYEAEPLPADWVTVLNRCGLVWSPSTYCRDLFRDAGVTTPIFVSGYGVDHETFYPIERPSESVQAGGPFRFLIWARGLVSRKNALLAARAFVAANLPADEAVLEVKVNEHFAADGMVFKDDSGRPFSNIHIRTGDWTDTELANWLRSGDCMIYLSAGEGFGLMPLEAMATGLPVICAHNTGMLDYLTPDNAWLVPTVGRAPAPSYTQRFGVASTWCKPDFDAAVELIRRAFYQRDEALKIGRRAAADVLANWSWEAAGRRALAEIRTHYGSGASSTDGLAEDGHAGS